MLTVSAISLSKMPTIVTRINTAKITAKKNRRNRNKRSPSAAPHISPCQFQIHYFTFFMFWVVKKSTLMGWLKTALL